MMRRLERLVLIVDRERRLAADVAYALTDTRSMPKNVDVRVLAETSFTSARTLLRQRAPHLLVTALQLGEYNGIHLVHIANAARRATRSVVHTDAVDAAQAREVRSAGAFYEIRSRLRVALPAYIAASLPLEDRRDPLVFDRRSLARGGRRAADFRPSL